MIRNDYRIRVTLPEHKVPTELGMLLEQLRYQGLIVQHKDGNGGPAVFDIVAPSHINRQGVQSWAERNVDRMKSFGYNVEVAVVKR